MSIRQWQRMTSKVFVDTDDEPVGVYVTRHGPNGSTAPATLHRTKIGARLAALLWRHTGIVRGTPTNGSSQKRGRP